MGYIGYADPNAGKHFCKTPSRIFNRAWKLWECDSCHKIWRLEHATEFLDDGWEWKEYGGVKVV